MSQGAAEVWLGLDLGTSGVKAVAIDADGAVVARGQARYPTRRPTPAASEQDPADWLDAVGAVVAQLNGQIAPRRWRGLGLSAMIPTLVTVDKHGQPNGPAITWEDARAEAHGERYREALGGEALYRSTGQWVDGRYLLPMYCRLAEEQPERARHTTALLGAKDYLFGWLTGQAATDPSTASGYGCFAIPSEQWCDDALAVFEAQVHGPAPAIPPVLGSHTIRPLRAGAAARLGLPVGLPVCVGGADSVLGAFGLGVREPGEVAYVAGTSNVIIGITEHWQPDPGHRYLLTPLAGITGYGLEMDLLCTGGAIRWLAGLLEGERDEATLTALAGETPIENAPVFLPYLGPGEQGVLWDPELAGALLGMTVQHESCHLARGLLNGILLESRRCLEVLYEAGLGRGDVQVAGGSAADGGFRRDLADCTRRRVLVPADGETDYSAVGAAMLVAQAVDGVQFGGRARAEKLAVTPNEAQAERWDRLWERHQTALEAVRTFYGQVTERR